MRKAPKVMCLEPVVTYNGVWSRGCTLILTYSLEAAYEFLTHDILNMEKTL
jgi:hypothetical protein